DNERPIKACIFLIEALGLVKEPLVIAESGKEVNASVSQKIADAAAKLSKEVIADFNGRFDFPDISLLTSYKDKDNNEIKCQIKLDAHLQVISFIPPEFTDNTRARKMCDILIEALELAKQSLIMAKVEKDLDASVSQKMGVAAQEAIGTFGG